MLAIGGHYILSKLEYITSAGIRVFLIIQKALGKNLTLTNVNSSMENYLSKKGLQTPSTI